MGEQLSTDAMSSLMRARSIVILGASTDPEKFANRPLVYLRKLGFAGPVFPVHPQAADIEGFRCYRSLDDVPGPVDVAIIARPAEHVPTEVARCIARGIRAFVVFSAGFAEAGPEGALLQQQLLDMCKSAGAVMCGPNCTGVVDAPTGAALSFMTNLDKEVAAGGSVALVSGSGSIAAMLFQGRGGLISSVASIGNEAVTTAADFIADAVEQPGISGVICFLEAIRDPQGMMSALRRASLLRKPVALLKGGRTARSAQVAATHTGAMVDDDMATQAMFDHCNAIRAGSIEELKLLATLMHAAASRSIGPGIGVLTPSGGTAVLIVDEITTHGLDLPELTEASCAALQELIPQATPANPMDITGFGANSQPIFSAAISAMLDDPSVDVLLVPMGGGVGKVGSGRAQALIEAGSRTGKLLVPIWQGTTREQPGYEAMLTAGLPVMTDYALLVAALGKLIAHRRRCLASQESLGPPTLLPAAALALARGAIARGDLSLSEPQVKAIFAASAIAIPAFRLLAPAGEAPEDLPLRFPVVLKVVSPDIVHKSAVGGVAMVNTPGELGPALRSMRSEVGSRCPAARIDGWLVEEVIAAGLELLVGIKRDAGFGCLLTLALGGTWANSLRGAVTALLPLTPAGARDLVRRFFHDSEEIAALDALSDLLLKLAAIAQALGDQLDVLEVNPVKLSGGPNAEAIALDGVLTFAAPPLLLPTDTRTP